MLKVQCRSFKTKTVNLQGGAGYFRTLLSRDFRSSLIYMNSGAQIEHPTR